MKYMKESGFLVGLLWFAPMVWAQEASGATSKPTWWAQQASSPAESVPAETKELQPESSAVPATVIQAAPGAASMVLPTGADFDCVEVKRFEAGNGFISSKEQARAAEIPEEKLSSIQRRVAGQIPEKLRGFKSTLVTERAPECPDPQRALVLSGQIVDFKEGNQALRYWVGFGAGAQKFSVLLQARRKSDGALIAEGEVTDRKIGGLIGGQAGKGEEDCAEKVAGFLKQALSPK